VPTSRKDFQQLLDRLVGTGPEASAMIKEFRAKHSAGKRQSIPRLDYRRLERLSRPFLDDRRQPDLDARLSVFRRELESLTKAKKITPPLKIKVKTVRSMRKAKRSALSSGDRASMRGGNDT
jgi:hypothetical protein